jgi:hypothetical protein
MSLAWGPRESPLADTGDRMVPGAAIGRGENLYRKKVVSCHITPAHHPTTNAGVTALAVDLKRKAQPEIRSAFMLSPFNWP